MAPSSQRCQEEMAAQIVDAGGDYVLAVKDNQGGVSEAVQDFFDEGQRRDFGHTVLDGVETVEKDHGRLETRRYTWDSRLDWMDRPMRSQWKRLASVGLVERRREIGGGKSASSTRSISARGALIRPRQWPEPHADTGAWRTSCTGCSTWCFAKTTVGCGMGMRRATSRRCAGSRCPCYARTPSTPSAACTAGVKRLTATPATARLFLGYS